MSNDIAAEQAKLIVQMADALLAAREIQAELLQEVKRLRHDLNECRTQAVRELNRKG